MATFESRVFGTLAVGADAFWSGETFVNGRRYVRSIFVGTGDSTILGRASQLVDDLDRLDVLARSAIARGKSESAVHGYIEHHLEVLERAEIERLFGAAVPDALAFLAKLELVGVAIHPTEDAGFKLVLDYSLGRDVSDELLAVRFTEAGEAVAVTHES